MNLPALRTHVRRSAVVAIAMIASAVGAFAQPASPILERHEGDDYTRYELLAPDSAQFRIIYEVTATRPGARLFFNVIRKGSEASDEAVFDQMTGQPLPFKVVTGAEARAAGQANADLEANYIQVSLARPVPEKGETRLRIEKTYKDAKSYYREGDPHRLQPRPGHHAQRGRAAEGLRTGRAVTCRRRCSPRPTAESASAS